VFFRLYAVRDFDEGVCLESESLQVAGRLGWGGSMLYGYLSLAVF
jgi:hypothetical protein